MNLYEILLPVTNNDGERMHLAHGRLQDFLLETIGGYTECPNVEGAWRNDTGLVMYDKSVPYRVTCHSEDWRKIVARAFELWPDQQAIFHTKLGEATIEERPLLSVPMDHAAYKEKFYYD